MLRFDGTFRSVTIVVEGGEVGSSVDGCSSASETGGGGGGASFEQQNGLL